MKMHCPTIGVFIFSIKLAAVRRPESAAACNEPVGCERYAEPSVRDVSDRAACAPVSSSAC